MIKINTKVEIIFRYVLNSFILILIIFFNSNNFAYGSIENWIEVSKNPAGIQYLDMESFNSKGKGIIEIKTKYLKINTYKTNEIEENIYITKINCLTNQFKDISVNGKKNLTAKWEEPNGDKLIDDLILNSCKNV